MNSVWLDLSERGGKKISMRRDPKGRESKALGSNDVIGMSYIQYIMFLAVFQTTSESKNANKENRKINWECKHF